jgi:hypothetical protein
MKQATTFFGTRFSTRFSALLALCLLHSPLAFAHKASDSFLYLDRDQSELRVDVALRDLALVLPLDANSDQKLSGAELRESRGRITQWTENGITLNSLSGECRLSGQTWGISQHSDGPYAAALYALECPNGELPETLNYTLLFKQDPLHRGLLSVTSGGEEFLNVLAPDKTTLALAPEGHSSALSVFGTFLYEGIFHLLIGLDHLLFLLVLMLPATLKQTDNSERRSLKKSLWQLTGVVTAFTGAHTITLILASLNIVRLPIAWVEAVIALSIAVAALNVAWPILGRKTWKLAFGFGLIHGFGFASVLGNLTSGLEQTALALAGFNLGVEVGQIALLLVAFPIFYLWGRTAHYGRAVVPALLLVTGAISLYWVAERAMVL